MGLLATSRAHDLGFIDADELVERLDATLTTVERLERFEGHLLNWYDTRDADAARAAYVSTVDSGNLAGALLTLAVGAAAARRLATATAGRRRGCATSPRAPTRSFDAMNFGFSTTRSGSCSHRLSARRRRGAGRLDRSFYDLLASEARLASFLAIAKGDVPESHWFHLGRAVTSVRGAPVLLSWSATMFEYLMPLLVMRSYPETLLDESCRMVGAAADRLRRAARRALGHLGVRLQRRRSARHLSVQGVRRARPRPEARARRRAGGRAVRHRARRDDRSRPQSAANLRRLAARASRATTASSTPSTTPTASAEREPAPRDARRRRSVVRTYSRTTRA